MSNLAPEEEEENDEEWLVTYADAITLLMAFFVMLVSFSKVDLPMFEAVQAGIEEQLGGVVESDQPIFSLHAQIQSIVYDTPDIPENMVEVGFDDQGVVIDFASVIFFKPGTTEITEPGLIILGKLKRELEEVPYDLFMIDVEGHTDDVPISTPRFPSNWELSSARAGAVVRHMITLELDEERFKASGYAHTKPKVPNLDLLGEPIQENREINRRVSVRLYPGFIKEAF